MLQKPDLFIGTNLTSRNSELKNQIFIQLENKIQACLFLFFYGAIFTLSESGAVSEKGLAYAEILKAYILSLILKNKISFPPGYYGASFTLYSEL